MQLIKLIMYKNDSNQCMVWITTANPLKPKKGSWRVKPRWRITTCFSNTFFKPSLVFESWLQFGFISCSSYKLQLSLLYSILHTLHRIKNPELHLGGVRWEENVHQSIREAGHVGPISKIKFTSIHS